VPNRESATTAPATAKASDSGDTWRSTAYRLGTNLDVASTRPAPSVTAAAASAPLSRAMPTVATAHAAAIRHSATAPADSTTRRAAPTSAA
jgi:hypothetical protein